MHKKLSEKQQQMLGFIRDFYLEHGLPPTVRNIQSACNISSTSVVDYNLHILQREGYIRRIPDVARGIEILDESGRAGAMTRVPVMGYIAAGEPLPTPSEDGWNTQPMYSMDLPREMAPDGRNLYALKVKGKSMIDALIDDGDVVLVEPVRQVSNGDMAVVMLKGEKEATLKRFHSEGSRVRLQPANSQMEPIFAAASNVEVQGRVVGVLRMMR